jgi:hypothetical protein
MGVVADQLRMQAERRPNMPSGGRKFMVSGPSSRRGSNREGEHALTLALLNSGRMVRVEVEVAMKIYKSRSHRFHDGAA